MIADDYIIELAVAEGLAQKLDTSKMENYGNLNPVFMSQFFDPQNEYTVPYGAGIPMLVYDPALTDLEITGYADLWDASLKDNIALTANYRVINGIALKVMGESYNTTVKVGVAHADPRLLLEAVQNLLGKHAVPGVEVELPAQLRAAGGRLPLLLPARP